MDPNVQQEKQIISPVVTPQGHVSTQSKGQFHVKPRLGQGRAGIKKNIIRFPIPQFQERPEQPKLIPGRKPIIQIAERPILQPPHSVAQPKTHSKTPPVQKPNFSDNLVSNSMIPKIILEHVEKTLSSDDHFCQPKKGNEIQDVRRGKPGYADPIYRPHPNQLKYLCIQFQERHQI